MARCAFSRAAERIGREKLAFVTGHSASAAMLCLLAADHREWAVRMPYIAIARRIDHADTGSAMDEGAAYEGGG